MEKEWEMEYCLFTKFAVRGKGEKRRKNLVSDILSLARKIEDSEILPGICEKDEIESGEIIQGFPCSYSAGFKDENPLKIKRKQNSPDDGFEPLSIIQHKGPVVEFDGYELDGFETKQGPGGAWTEAALWETRGGNWVLEVRNCSDQPGHQDFVDAYVLDQDDMLDRQIKVMNILKWSSWAREMAKRLGWDMRRRVD